MVVQMKFGTWIVFVVFRGKCQIDATMESQKPPYLPDRQTWTNRHQLNCGFITFTIQHKNIIYIYTKQTFRELRLYDTHVKDENHHDEVTLVYITTLSLSIEKNNLRKINETSKEILLAAFLHTIRSKYQHVVQILQKTSSKQ